MLFEKNVSFIYSVITLPSKIAYYLSRLSRALKLTSLLSCLFKFRWKVCMIKAKKMKVNVIIISISINISINNQSGLPGVRIWQGSGYARVSQGSKYDTVCLNMWICLKISEFMIIDRILNTSHRTRSPRSLYNLMSTYWEIDVFRTLSI